MEGVALFVKEWWAVLLFLIGGVWAVLMGRERNAWRIDQVGRKIEEVERRVSHLETQGAAEAVTLAEIKIQLATVIETLGELRAELKGKADK